MRRRLTTNEFICRAKLKHRDKYDYSDSVYITARNKIKIVCPQHGSFYQRPHDHLNGCGCSKCVKVYRRNNDEFINDSIKIFGTLFSYHNVNYINSQTNVVITCKLHGNFKIIPNNHLTKQQGCPICKESKGEKKIREYMLNKNIKFVQEKKFDDCVGKRRKLPFDFFIPHKNLVIEYDGKHHFEMVSAFGGVTGFNETKKNDKIKNNYLHENNIDLLRISYKEYDNIELILAEIIK